MKSIRLLATVFVALLVGYLLDNFGSAQPTSDTQTLQRQLAAEVVIPPDRSFFWPVHIFRDGEFWASGTLIETPQGRRVITSQLVFRQLESASHLYAFKNLYDKDSLLQGISAIEVIGPAQQREAAPVICTPGQAEPIVGMVDFPRQRHLNTIISPTPDQWLESVATSKIYPVYGVMSWAGVCIFDFQGVEEERGSGFRLNSKDEVLVVLEAGEITVNDELREIIPKLSAATKTLSYGFVVVPVPPHQIPEIPSPAAIINYFFPPQIFLLPREAPKPAFKMSGFFLTPVSISNLIIIDS